MASFCSLYRYANCRDWALMVLGLLAVLASGANQPAQLYVFGRILDDFNSAVREEVQAKINFFALCYALLGLQIFVTTAVQASCFSAVAATQIRRIREKYFAALLRRPPNFVDAQGGGALATSVLEATTVIGAGMGDDLAVCLQRVLAFLIGLGLAAYTSWKLTLVVLVGIPALGGTVALANRAFARDVKESSKMLEAASSQAMELIAAIRTVAAFGYEHEAIQTYRTAAKKAAEAGIRQGKGKAALEGIMAPIMFVMFGLGLWWGSKLVSDDMDSNVACRYVSPSGQQQDPDHNQCQTGGNIMTAFLSILFGFIGLLQALPGISALAAARASARRVFDVIDSEVGVIDPFSDEGDRPQNPRGKIELANVAFAYPGRKAAPVYCGLCLTIDAGQTVALVGPSGCGKSTMVGLLERFYDVDGGQVLLDGVDIKKLNLRWLRAQIGLVSQEPVLFEGSIGDNIGSGRPGASQSEIEAAATMANAHSFVAKFPDSYGTFVGEKGIQLSGGQKQRIAIARAIVRDPLILILDEATSALDTESEVVVQKALDELLKAKKRTTVVIAHRLSTIRDADKIAVISRGEVVEEGTHEKLMQNSAGVYSSSVQAAAQNGVEIVGERSETSPAELSGKAMSEGGSVATGMMGKDLTDEKQQEGGSPPKLDREPSKEQSSPVRWLLGLSSPEKWYFASGLLGASITGLALPAIGFLMAEFIIVFFHPSSDVMRTEARKWALVFISIGLLNACGAVLRQYSFAVVTERLVVRVRCAAFTAILRQNIGWFDASSDHTAGALVNQLASDCFLVKALTGERASIALSQAVVLGAGLYIAFDSSWHLTLVVFAIIPLIVLPVALQAKVVGKYSARATECIVDSGRLVSETLLQLRTVAAFGLEVDRLARLSDGLDFPMRQEVRKGVAIGVGSGVAAGVVLFAAAFKYIVGGIFFDAGLLEFGDIMRVVLVLIFMAFGMSTLSKDASDKAEAMVAARRVHRLVSTESRIDAVSVTGAVPLERARGHVELVAVDFAYPSRQDIPVYRGLSLTMEAGQTVALAGPSGCGKSTLVALLERFYDVDGGKVLLDGADIRSLDVRWLRSQIGLVSQEPVLFSGTVGWNIALGREGASRGDAVVAAGMANADGFINELPQKYDEVVGERGVQLSGGQKQRVAIARALVRDPAVLVLDEATSALDVESERTVQVALDHLMSTRQRTTIVIAHRLSTIQKADKICVFSDGAVVEEGKHEALLQREGGVYRALVLHDRAGQEGSLS